MKPVFLILSTLILGAAARAGYSTTATPDQIAKYALAALSRGAHVGKNQYGGDCNVNLTYQPGTDFRVTVATVGSLNDEAVFSAKSSIVQEFGFSEPGQDPAFDLYYYVQLGGEGGGQASGQFLSISGKNPTVVDLNNAKCSIF